MSAAFWVVSTLLMLAAAYPAEEYGLARGALAAIPFTMVAAWRGWRAALLLAPVALAAFWGGAVATGSVLEAGRLVPLAFALTIATLVGQRLHQVWSANERRAAFSERRARLLQHAALELNQADDQERLFETGLRLLSEILRFDHAEVFVPQGGEMVLQSSWSSPLERGFSLGLRGVIGRAFRTAEPQYVPDTHQDPEFVPVPGEGPEGTRTEVALPLKHMGAVVAVLNLELSKPNAFDASDHAALKAFTRIMEEVLERIAARQQLSLNTSDQEFFARLGQELLHADSAGQAAGVALAGLLSHLPVISAATVVMLAQSRLRPLAMQGELPIEFMRHGIAYGGPGQRSWEGRTSSVVEDLATLGLECAASPDAACVALLLPVVNSQAEVQALLIAVMPPALVTDERVRHIVDTVCDMLAVSLWRTTLNRRLLAVLEVVRRISRTDDPDDLFQQAAEAAVELIPDAESATVLVREQDSFRFAGAVGFDLEQVLKAAGPFTFEEQLRWYGESPERYRRGVARVLRGAAVQAMSFASSPARSPANLKGARVAEMKANVLVPITVDGEVVALLNVDNYSTEHAFGSSAVRVAEAYAQHIAVIVRQARHVDALEKNLVTDGLTGLGNRVGLQRAVAEELERAKRYSQPLNFVMIDLDNFKVVNDSFGHAVGDQALRLVADVLRHNVRQSDLAFRWGGDEFVVTLPGVNREEATEAANRYIEMIGKVEVEGMALSASYGIASFPDDGGDAETLLKFADQLMYQDKARGLGRRTSLGRHLVFSHDAQSG